MKLDKHCLKHFTENEKTKIIETITYYALFEEDSIETLETLKKHLNLNVPRHSFECLPSPSVNNMSDILIQHSKGEFKLSELYRWEIVRE